jgi:hypothetical protein
MLRPPRQLAYYDTNIVPKNESLALALARVLMRHLLSGNNKRHPIYPKRLKAAGPCYGIHIAQ